MIELACVTQFAPLAAFGIILLGGRLLRPAAPAIAVAGAGSALAANLGLLSAGALSRHETFRWTWLALADIRIQPLFGVTPARLDDVSVGFLLDPLNILMLTIVTTVSFFVQLFSVFYMAEDGDRPRYFAFLSLFSFSMIGLVFSVNLLQTFMFWELVGLASYLLIGFWFEKAAASQAARKAFVLNRLADLGFLAGILILFLCFGTLDLSALGTEGLRAALPARLLGTIGVLIFLGIAGKSAQFPFHVWLPDAMEGPTPVSALIHSATMVAAGVFLFSRIFGLFAATPAVLKLILAAGTLTALLGATLATIQRDIKRILAYSTISQLGLMVMGIAAGSPGAGMFHLTTHAFFKSLLFLTAGALIHRFETNDIFEMGEKGSRHERFLLFFLAFGLLSLSGVPPFGGFFSKDAILHELRSAHSAVYGAGLLVGLFTAYYSFRLFLVLFLSRATHETHAHPASPLVRICEKIPLAVLAILSLAAGAAGTSAGGAAVLEAIDPRFHPLRIDAGLLLAASGVIAAGAAGAFLRYRRPKAPTPESPRNPWVRLLEQKYFMDDLYLWVVKNIGLRIAAFFHGFDVRVVNGIMVNETARSVKRLGKILSGVQNGQLQNYLFVALVLLTLVVGYFIRMSS